MSGILVWNAHLSLSLLELDAETATTLSIGCLRLPDATLPRPSFVRAPFSCATSSGACGEANYRRVTNSKLSIIALRHAAAGCGESWRKFVFCDPPLSFPRPRAPLRRAFSVAIVLRSFGAQICHRIFRSCCGCLFGKTMQGREIC